VYFILNILDQSGYFSIIVPALSEKEISLQKALLREN